MTTENIGIIGTGRMGTAIATRLIALGHRVNVWNRTPKAMTAAIAAGAHAADSIAALCQNSDVLISSLTDYAALDDLHRGDGGLLAQDISGMLYIEMSTLLPDQQQALEARVIAADCGYLECPVGGTVGPALKGMLLGMAGGGTGSWDRARPLLEGLCKRVEHLGPVGAGSAMKLAVNLPLALYWASLGETMGVLRGQGLSGATVASLMAVSSAGPNVLKNRMEIVASTLDGTDHPGTFDINGLNKDLTLALEWAQQAGARMPVTTEVQKTYARAIDRGLGAYDGASLSRFVMDS
mgnify:CR=1 FL=1